MTKLVEFYLGESTDSEGRTFHEIMEWDDDRLEYVHDYIQWLFPLREPSNFNPDAPLLTDEDVKAWQEDMVLRYRLVRAAHKFLHFLGLELVPNGASEGGMDWYVVKGTHFSEREWIWKNPNHNWLRVSRMLASLSILGLNKLALATFECLKQLREAGYASENTFNYWRAALEAC